MPILRSVAAVVGGMVVTVVLVLLLTYLAASVTGVGMTGPPTTTYLVLNLLGGAIAGAAGGATAVRVAPHTPHGHVFALAALLLLLSLPALFSAPAPGQPAWYPLVLSILGPTSVLVGGLLARPAPSGAESRPR